MSFFRYSSPVGPLEIFEETGRIVALRFVQAPAKAGCAFPARPCGESGAISPATPLLAQAEAELTGYFAGSIETFTLPLGMRGTAFQLAVWEALLAIPYGTRASYGEIARAVGRPHGARAVGMACNRNPLAIFVPCHRVVASSGALTGYSGGLDAKVFLLDLEARRQPHLL